MRSRTRLLMPAILAMQFATIGAAANTVEAAAPRETLCDYCADYTDAATSGGSRIPSDYKPVLGYAASSKPDTAATQAKLEDASHRMMIFRAKTQ